MVADLKATVVNMKTLAQHIDDPVVVNAADADGRRLRIVFTQEAAAQLAPHTKVYLSWHHQQNNIKGYNVFTELPRENKKQPPAWEICFPQSMLYCGDVLACIELVDDISIAASTNFMIHVLEDPNDGVPYIFSDDYSEFKLAVISLNSLADEVRDQMADYAAEWENMQLQHQYMLTIVEETHELNEEMQVILQNIQDEVDATLADLQQQLDNWIDTQEAELNEWLENAEATLSYYSNILNNFETRLQIAETNAADAINAINNLAAVATSGAAADVATTTATGLTATNVEDALIELNNLISTTVTNALTWHTL